MSPTSRGRHALPALRTSRPLTADQAPSKPMFSFYSNTDNSSSLANRLGTTYHLSPLLMKAKRLGFTCPEDLERLAVRRGLRYYDPFGDSVAQLTKEAKLPEVPCVGTLTNEELAVALLSPANPYSMQRLRMSAAIMAADGNDPETIARLAKWERSESIVRHIASCGHQVEPSHPFWSQLLEHLPESPPHPDDKLPHHTRFVAMTGITRAGKEPLMQWIRPSNVQHS